MLLNVGCCVAHDCMVGDHAHLAPSVMLGGGVVTFGAGVFCGTAAVVLPDRRVGDWAVCGAGAVITRDVPDGALALGVPARCQDAPVTREPAPGSGARLAFLGGSPAFAQPLHVGRPNIGDRERFLGLANELLDRRWLTNNGPLVQELERRIADTSACATVVAMCNGTVALEIAIRALGLRGEVILPSYTFVATAHALQWQEITPVFADIDPATHNIDPAAVERMITPRTTGIIGVHLWGAPAPSRRSPSIARRHGLKLMFDAAHAFGCQLPRPQRRRLRARGGVQLPRHQVLQHLRGWRRHHQRRRTRARDALDAQLRLRGLRQRRASGHQRQDDRDLARRWA